MNESLVVSFNTAFFAISESWTYPFFLGDDIGTSSQLFNFFIENDLRYDSNYIFLSADDWEYPKKLENPQYQITRLG